MSKYKFQDGGDASGADMFNAYVDQFLQQEQQQQQEQEYGEQAKPEEDPFIEGLLAYDEEASETDEQALYTELQNRIAGLEEQLNLKEQNSYQQQYEQDWFADDESHEYLTNMYSTANKPTANTGSFSGIFKVEGAKTGQPTNLNSSAIGRGQMIKGTREAMYKKLGIPQSQYGQAEQRFKTDPNFEMQVLEAYRSELDARIPAHIKGKQREYMIAKGWYTGDVNYPDNKVPGREAGNKLTAGQYARKAIGAI